MLPLFWPDYFSPFKEDYLIPIVRIGPICAVWKKHILLGSSLIGYYSDFRQYISTDIRILLYFQSIFNFLVKNKYSIQGPWKIHALRSINVISNGKQCVLSENRTNPLVRISIMCLARNIQIFYGAPLVRQSILVNILRVCLVNCGLFHSTERSEYLVYWQIKETACHALIPFYHLEKPFMCSTR